MREVACCGRTVLGWCLGEFAVCLVGEGWDRGHGRSEVQELRVVVVVTGKRKLWFGHSRRPRAMRNGQLASLARGTIANLLTMTGRLPGPCGE